MPEFYTSVERYGNRMLLRGVNDRGRHFKRSFKYEPYFFTPCQDPTSEFKTLEGQPLSKIPFKSIKDAKLYYEASESVYGLDSYQYVFIHDTYPSKIEYDSEKIRVGIIDIECWSDRGFPNIILADQPITAITLRYKGRTATWGLKEFQSDDPNVFYGHCEDETDLLRKFLIFWQKVDFDVITGFNIEWFDIPYLVNRIKRVLNTTEAEKLSPWGLLKEKNTFIKGKKQSTYIPLGIAVLDYFQLYQKFAYTRRGQEVFKESKALNYIASKELGEKKLSYAEYASLTELYEKDHQKYILYNQRDCYLVDKLEEKLRYIELIYAVAYGSHVNYVDALSTVKLWDVIVYNYLMDKNIICPKAKHTPKRELRGAWVKEPLVGAHDWIITYDIQSMYPHLTMQYNISPETFEGKVHDLSVNDLLNGELKSTSEEWKDFSEAANGCAYTKKFKGFVPTLMEEKFNQRAEFKKLMKAATDEDEIKKYDGYQNAMKVVINGFYGAFANESFRYFDINHAEAITTSGQLVIRWVIRDINAYINSMIKTKDIDYVIAADTDSMILNAGPIVTFLERQWGVQDKQKTIDCLAAMCTRCFDIVIRASFNRLAQMTNAYQQSMFMKREAIADRAIWAGAKNYMLNIWDQEGKRYAEPKLKVSGVEAVRSSTPELSRNALIQAIKIVMAGTEKELHDFVEDFETKFMAAPLEDIAFPTGVTNIGKWLEPSGNFKKGAPIYVKAALVWNNLVAGNTHLESIYNGNKIKWCHLIEPNPINSPVVAFPSFLPPELNLDEYVDKREQFIKTFLNPLQRITDIIGWQPKFVDTLDQFFIEGT